VGRGGEDRPIPDPAGQTAKSLAQAEYERRLDEHSFVHRVDPLRDAVRRAVSAWHQEDSQEKNDLSEEFWSAMGDLEDVLESVKR
jgi:hypothetical protein